MYEIIKQNKGLSIERLLLLCEVANAGGIKAAVGDDATRQSLASRQLKEISEYAGTELTRKLGRTLEMSEKGKQLAEIGNAFFSQLETFLRTTHNLQNRFNLGIGDSLFQWQLLPKMKSFATKFPKVQLVPFSFPATEIIRKVDNRVLDAGLVRQTAIPNRSDIVVKNIGEIKYKLFIPAALIKNGPKHALPEIHTLPFCTLTGDGEYVHAMSTFMAAFNGHPVLNCSSMTQMYAAIQSNQYAAILPADAATGLNASTMKIYTLPELAPFTRQIALIYKSCSANDADKAAILEFLSHSITKDPS